MISPRPAYTRIALARFGIQMYDPANGHEACRLALMPTPEVNSLAVDAECIYYNEDWVRRTADKEIEAAIREAVATARVTDGR